MRVPVKAEILGKEITGNYEPLELLEIIDRMIVEMREKQKPKEGV